MARRATGLRALGETVAKVTGPIMSRQGFAGGAIVAEWPAIVGEQMAAQSIPEKVIHSRDKNAPGTLRLSVASGGIATELQHLAPLLLDRINTYFGYQAIDRLQFVHRPMPHKTAPRRLNPRALTPEEEQRLADSLVGIDNPELRQSIEGLARTIIGRDSPHDPNDPFGGN